MRKKLIEVALPLEAINRESAREKSIRHGHPSTLHLWWSRKPTATCRAVLFASLVDDPSSRPEEFPTEEAQERERQRLFGLIEDLVKWENSNNEVVLEQARAEILRSTDGNPPPVLDPFCGGGSIPLEAQRLGLEAHGSDLNPVAVLITKALIEIPPKFAGRAPVNPASSGTLADTADWRGAAGLAADVRYYGQWMREEAEKRIGHLYPKATLPKEHGGGGEATVIAWLWARTVQCPNPACGAQMPLVSKWWLSTKKGKEAWVEPVADRGAKSVRFEVRTGEGTAPEGTVDRRGATCLCCAAAVPLQHVRAEGKADRMNAQLMAVVAEGQRGRVYLSPTAEHAVVANHAVANDVLDTDLPEQALGFRIQSYGMTRHRDLFTSRQLVALTTFSDLVGEARERVLADARAASLPDDGVPLNECGRGATAYADAVATYLAFALSRCADRGSSICSWDSSPKMEALRNTFARQAIPMTWDYAEGNPFSQSTGNWMACIDWIWKVIAELPCSRQGAVRQLDATQSIYERTGLVVSTDPPYYDNIGYADLSDFFYVWLRRSLGKVHPDLFDTLLVPKAAELVATPHRFGGDKNKACAFFEQGLARAFDQMRKGARPEYPLTIYYAFKQSEADDKDGDGGDAAVASTGWETMLEGLLQAEFSVGGTWPMRSELGNRPRGLGSNALASSIVLVCRPRPAEAPMVTRREFLAALKRELPQALREMQQGGIAPVDLAQAAIGPGMAVFSRYSRVLEADGTPMRVRTALTLINRMLDEVLSEGEGEFDADTRWALAWFEQHGTEDGPYGVAETLSKAKNTSVTGLVEAGILESRAGKVRLLCHDQLRSDWEPQSDSRLTVWETTQHLLRALGDHGETGAARLLKEVGDLGEVARDLAYRLYSICERNKWSQEGQKYNGLVASWPEITRLAAGAASGQRELF